LYLNNMCRNYFINSYRNFPSAQYIQDKVLHVYTFGSPPVTCLEKVAMQTECVEDIEGQAHCNILSYLGLPSTLVKGYTQPWVSVAIHNKSLCNSFNSAQIYTCVFQRIQSQEFSLPLTLYIPLLMI